MFSSYKAHVILPLQVCRNQSSHFISLPECLTAGDTLATSALSAAEFFCIALLQRNALRIYFSNSAGNTVKWESQFSTLWHQTKWWIMDWYLVRGGKETEKEKKKRNINAILWIISLEKQSSFLTRLCVTIMGSNLYLDKQSLPMKLC